MKYERIENAKRNVIWGIVNRLTVLLMPFILRTVLIKTLGVDYLGLSSLFSSVLQVLCLAELGFDSAIVYSMYKPIAEEDSKTICALLNLYKKVYRIIGMFILIMGIVITPILKYLIKGTYPADVNIELVFIIYLINTVISYWTMAYKISLLKAHQREDINSKVISVMNLLLNISQILLLLIFANYYFYIIIFPIITLLSNILRARVVSKMYPNYFCYGKISNAEKQELTKRISGILLYKIGGVFRTAFDNVILAMFLGLVAVAKYQNYYTIVLTASGFISILYTSIIPGIGNSIALESKEKNFEDFKKFMFAILWIGGWFTVAMLCLFQNFMEIWLGKEALLQMRVVFLLCIYFYVLKIGDITYVYREAAGLWWEDRYRPIIESIVNLVLNIVLVKNFGIEGVIMSTIIAIVCIALPWTSKVLFAKYFEMSTKYFWKTVFIFSIITILAGGITYYLCSNFAEITFVNIVIKIFICIFVPNIIFGLTNSYKEEWCYFYALLKKELGKH